MKFLKTFGLGWTALVAWPSAAQQPNPAQAPDQIEEIVVTAQKRETNLQTTPLAIAAISGADLASRQENDIDAVFQVLPNVHFGENEGQAQISIRGIGFDNVAVGGEGRVAFHEDGVYISRPDAILGTVFDVDRIEVVSGPQGTLYGRNATAGAINVISKDPTTDFDGYVRTTVGSYNLFKVEAAASGSLAPGWTGRIAAESTDRDGYGRDLTTGTQVDDDHERAVRAKLRYETPDGKVRVTLAADGLNENDHAFSASYLGGAGFTAAGVPIIPTGIRFGGSVPNTSNPYDIEQDVDPRLVRTLYGLSANAQADLGGVTLTSISAYRYSDFRSVGDLDRTSAKLSSLEVTEHAEQASEEIRLNGTAGPLRYDVGGYYFHENIFGYTWIPVNRAVIGLPSLFVGGYAAGGALVTDAEAGFFNVDYTPVDQWTITVGGRYSAERKSIDEFYTLNFAIPYVENVRPPPQKTDEQAASWSDFTPLGTIAYKPTGNLYLYVTASTGFKSGGFNLGGFQPPFAPEKLTDYEGGVKADWIDHRLRTNLSIFYYDYKNLQVNEVTPLSVEVVNAAKAKLTGIEAEVTAKPFANLTLSADGSLLNSRYEQFATEDSFRPQLGLINLAGNRLDQAPPYKYDLAAEYAWPVTLGKVTLRGEVSGTGKTYFSPYDLDYVAQRAYAMGNAYVTVSSQQNWTAGLYVRNLTDTVAYSNKFISSSLVGGALNGVLEPPRTFGVTLDYHF